MPATEEQWLQVGKKFHRRWNFPRCVGAIDGKHVRIQCPPASGSQYYNYKGFFSLILFAIVDAEYDFIYVNIGASGRAGDAAIWNECSFKQALEQNTLNLPTNHVCVGDDAFPLKTYLLKPYSKRNLSRREKVFNYRLSRARRIVENAFGILTWRFRIFQRAINLKLETTENVIWAACSLHNWLRNKNPVNTIALADKEDQNTGRVTGGKWREGGRKLPSLGKLGSNNYSSDAEKVRSSYAEYFVHDGAIPWQWKLSEVSENSSDEELSSGEITDDEEEMDI